MSKVVQFDRGKYRRRLCSECGHRWTTIELSRSDVAVQLDWACKRVKFPVTVESKEGGA